jgi:hypothetical protein
MISNPTEDIRAARRELAAQLGNDIHLIAEDARLRQQESGREYISLPSRKPLSKTMQNQTVEQTTKN